jgi:ankyrin repeat protein
VGWPSRLTYQQVAATGIRRSLTVLATYGDVDGAVAALAANSSLADDPEAVAAAAEHGHEAIVRLILDRCPRVIERVVAVAATRELTELLFERGMNPNVRFWLGVTPLHRFAREGNIQKATVYLDHGASLDMCDEEFCTTPLGYAARAGRLPMVEFFLDRGAALTWPGAHAWATPLALARHEGHEGIVRLLEAREGSAGKR